MAEKIPAFPLAFTKDGIIRNAALDDVLSPENTCQMALNFNFDQIGVYTLRKGITRLGGIVELNKAVLGMTNYRNNAGNNYKLLAKLDTDVYAYDGSSWVSVRNTLTASSKARFTNFVDYVFMVNGNGNQTCATYNGSGSFGSTNVASLPAGDFIENYRSRIWVGDSASDKLYYSDVVTTSNTITGGTEFIQISPQDGEKITGLQRYSRALLVFKQNHIYRVYNTTNVDPYPAYNVGTFSQESIVQAKDGIYFHHSSGFYKFSYDTQPTEISRRVIDFVKAIPRSSYENIVGVYDGFDAVKWSVGSITVEGVTYANCQMRYSISTQVWTIYDFAGTNITALISYDNGTTIDQIAGTSTGLVGKLDSGTTDFGNDIYYEIIDRWRSFTEQMSDNVMYSQTKNISGVMVMTENGAGMELQYQTEKSTVNKWENIDSVKNNYAELFPNASTDDFNNVRLRLKGYTKGTPIIYHGTEILSIQIKGMESN